MLIGHLKRQQIAIVLSLLLVLQLIVPAYFVTSVSAEEPPVTDDVFEIQNPGFETGDLTGWTVVEGSVFGSNSVSNETTWWAEEIPYNQEGAYHLNGWKTGEAATGKLRSSTFTLGGSGWISFKLGGGKNTEKVHVNVVDAESGKLVARYGNTAFADVNFPNVEQGMRLANMVQYKADLSAQLGKKLFLEIVDQASNDWGALFADAFFTYHLADPAEGVLASDLTPDLTDAQIENAGFETGDLTGWTVIEGDAFGPTSVTDSTYWWAENIPYNQEGSYHLNGWQTSEANTGKLRSSTFTLGGSGWTSFKLGGGKNTETMHVNVVEAGTGNVVAKFGNTEFADVNVPHVDQGMRLANMVQYKADLSLHLGKELYLEIIDAANSDWGVLFADAFFMYLAAEPMEGILATNLQQTEITNELVNPSFETGNMAGWTIVSGGAFGPDSVSGDATWWAENIPYNQEGTYHLNGWKHLEAETGVVRSSNFLLGGSGWISFKLGGAKNPGKAFINIVEADTGKVIARYGNSEFADINFPDPGLGMRLANMEQYKADLSDHLGKELYVEIVDYATNDWGIIIADAFFMHHEVEPAEGVVAADIKPDFERYQVDNPSFETGDLTGWTIVEGQAFDSDSVSDETTYWNENIPYHQEGSYHLNGLRALEAETGKLRSSTFELSGTGWISFRLGGGKHTEQVYVNVVDADTGKLIARYGNTEFADVNFPNPDQGLRLANMERYRADLSKHIGKNLYFEIVDNGTSDWGMIFADAFHVFNEIVPAEGIYAVNAIPTEIANRSFETGDFSDWTKDGSAFQVMNEALEAKEGTFYAASSVEGEGSITSNVFTLQGAGVIKFRILENQNPEDAYVALFDADSHAMLQKTGDISGNEQISWSVQEHFGKQMYVKVIDNSNDASIAVDGFQAHTTGNIAHLSLDDGSGKTALEEVRNLEHDVNYVFNDARYMNSKDPRWSSNGVKGGALLFDGYSNYIEIDAEEIVPVNDALTIEAWVSPRSYEWGDGNKLSAIVNQSDQDKAEGFALGMYRHGSWSMQVGIGGQWIEVWVHDRPLEKYKWNHVVATFDKEAGMIKLYLNGEEAASKATPINIPITPSTENLIIGKNSKPVELAGLFSFNMFSGLMDEVNLRNKALTAQEVLAQYESVKALHGGEVPNIPDADIDEDPSVFDGDQHRPQYHAIPPQNWMNEAHAPFYYNGKYHLFYQHNPQGPFWHQIHWGHWVSDDMVHWENVKPALAPEAGTLDPDGAWSGGATYDADGNPVLFYTAGNDSLSPNQRTAIATPADLTDPYLEDWVKHPEPVTEQNGNGIKNEFRDPFVWYDEEVDKWYQLVTSGMDDFSSGTALIYVSDDMYNWEYKGPLYTSNRSVYPELGTVWELPVLLPLGTDSQGDKKHIFIINPHEKPEHVLPTNDVQRDVEVFYWIGNWDRDSFRFIPDQEEPSKLDVGDGYLTAESGLVTPDGRSVIFSMVQNVRTPQAEYSSGWAHNLALPIALSLDSNDKLKIEPIEELHELRGTKLVDFTNKNLNSANAQLNDVKGDMLEIVMEIDPGEAQKFGLKVRRSDNGEEETLIYYDKSTSTFNVDRTKSSIDPDVRVDGIQGGYVELDGENLKLHIYLDRSVVEAFANYKKKLTTRVYVGRYDSLGLQVWADNDITVKSMEVWDMNALTGEPAAPVYVPENWDNTVYNDITELPNHDFATGDLTDWITEGDAFQDLHVSDVEKFWDEIYFNPSQKIPGGYHLWGYNEAAGGDSLTGTLKSENFILGGNGRIDFLISGGRDIDRLYVALVRASDGAELFKATATNYEEYQRKIWDASDYIGEELYMKVVDQSSGGFGHINVDDFNVPVRINENSVPDGNVMAGPKSNGQGKIIVKIAKGEKKALLPADSAAIDGKNDLVIIHEDVELEIPADVLAELQKLVTDTERKNAQILFEMDVVNADTVKELLEKAKSKNKVNVKTAGDVFEFNVAIVTEDGITKKLTKFSKSIRIKLSVSDEANLDVVGIYNIADDGSLEYVGGRYENGQLTAEVQHFSKYAVLEYDKSFKDVSEQYWAHDAIRKLAAKHIVQGISETEFGPKQEVTRAEFTAFIARALELEASAQTSFKDVDSTMWYAKVIAAAFEAGIVTGHSADEFAPNKTITRQEMAMIIVRAFEYKSGKDVASSANAPFMDGANISPWAKDAVNAAAELGLIQGRGNKQFVPNGYANRAESVQVVSKLLAAF
ncbi:GH32 C-terminal domain-containing protein [Paenibacillus sp. 2TAB23]|uniref:S-layer homology domain-containing protein n=1 Tax=Paenibacillus sp. 2TAB23 TaxID=3233004 RepID=UPI003F957240